MVKISNTQERFIPEKENNNCNFILIKEVKYEQKCISTIKLWRVCNQYMG